ncbi:MAG: hypothetical protein A2Y67_03705 [Candidatus Buchananbacteria bacterium RBG_13_39_9]|uniref:Uncharacterized protein n=1 Tax=Candidatus Buchananbacteria bacterium RBG_13_39_9 TaxID=1797531 RepID=A0A1G1XRV3_9BACT|nr:MAG: hypothetical protein A2Y67_03705 [Candidatus Buchananbacteria bacterium RBG_13_39_9]
MTLQPPFGWSAYAVPGPLQLCFFALESETPISSAFRDGPRRGFVPRPFRCHVFLLVGDGLRLVGFLRGLNKSRIFVFHRLPPLEREELVVNRPLF